MIVVPIGHDSQFVVGHDRIGIFHRIPVPVSGGNICQIRNRIRLLALDFILVDVANKRQSSLQQVPLCNIWSSLCCCAVKWLWVSRSVKWVWPTCISL